MSFFSNRFSHIDPFLVAAALPLLFAGWITMNSFGAENYFADRQLLWIIVSIFVMLLASFIDWRFLRRTSVVVVIYILALLSLIWVLIFADITKGVQSWITLGPVSLQPADFVKLALIIVLAKYFTRRHVEIAHYKHIIVTGLYALIPFFLIFLQPDFGSAAIIFLIWLGVILVSGVSRKHLFILFATGLASVLLLWNFALAPYQKARIVSFVNPLEDVRGAGYNAFQSTIAVGSGGLLGKGVGLGTQSRLSFLPEYQTDFIFAAFSEEWGLVGSLILFLLFAIVIWRVLKIASRGSSNFEVLFGFGLAILFMSHFAINVGMNIGLLPVTGITLPLVSYGGSHLVAEFLGLGMLMGMSRYNRAVHRDDLKQEFLGLGT